MLHRSFQKSFHSRFYRTLIPTIVIIAGLLLAAVVWAPSQRALAAANSAGNASGTPLEQLWRSVWSAGTAYVQTDPLTAAWKRVQAAGSYHFSSDVTQTTTPSASVLNAGRRSQTDQIYLEGMADMDATAMEFRLWSGGGSVLQEGSSLSARVADGKTYTKQNAGEWQEASDFTQSLAPAGDFMSYLVAARDITDLGAETRAGFTFTRYAFTLDGPTFANSVRQQMAEAMRLKGDVPDGVSFELPAHYSNMTGHGELWVGQDGLPVRQILALQFPEQDDEAVSAHITVNFSRFGYAQGATVAGGAAGTGSATTAIISLYSFFDKVVQALPAQLALVASLLLTLLLMGALVYYRRVRLLQQAISFALIGSFVVGPALSTLRTTRFLDAQTARAETQATQQEESNLARDMRSADSAPAFDPHQSPLAAAPAEAALAQPMAAGLAAPVAAPALQATNVLTTPNGLDSDGDGLSDFAEQRIGTNPNSKDTDGDLLLDKQEVDGFTYGGKKWYTDPNNVDSNNDGASDTLERDADGNNVPDDTDGDGVPDLFDNDNDNDGVPDDLDIAPFAKINATFTQNSPLELQVANSTNNVPLFVDFQLRPVDENQLWFAFNALDWPQDDKGQIQNVDAQLAEMKLVPMLEISIPDASIMLPPAAVLAPYGISTSQPDGSGAQKAYVPLALITDEKSGARVAFGGRMRYLQQSGWVVNQDVRLVWVVQMKNDTPCAPGGVGYDASTGYCLNQPAIVHRYYEDWKLTGLTITEEHGANIALIHQDPALPGTTVDDSPLAALTYALEQRFLMAGNGAGGTGRVVTPSNIRALFDRGANGGAAKAAYNVPNVFRIETTSYPTFDEAIYKTAAEKAPAILNSNFAAPWASNNTLKPLLMMAYEQNYRSLSLDALQIANAYATISGNSGNLLTFNLHPSNQAETPKMTMVGLKWSPYCGSPGNAGAVKWTSCAADTYWLELAARHANQYLSPTDPTVEVNGATLDRETAVGQTVVTQLFVLAMMQGMNTIIQESTASLVRTISDTTGQDSDVELNGTALALTRSFASFGVKKLANTIFIRTYASAADVIKQTAQFNFDEVLSLGTAAKTLYNFRTTPRESGAFGIALVASAVAISILIDLAVREKSEGAQLTLGVIMTGFSTIFGVIAPIYTAVNVVRSGAAPLFNVLSNSKFLGLSRTGAAAGAAVAIAVTWGFAIYSIVSNKVPAFSPAFNFAIADAVAATIFIILATILSLTGIGLIIVGIVTVIDLILTLVCQFGNDRDQARLTNKNGSCITISGAVTNAIASLLYAYDIMIDAGRADLVNVGVPKIALADPNTGYAVGANLSVAIPVTTTIVNKKPELRNSVLILPYIWFFSKDTLRSTTFKYSLTSPISETLSAQRNELSTEWAEPTISGTFAGKNLYATSKVNNVSRNGGLVFDQPSLNRKFDMHLNMAYALPVFECWVMPSPVGLVPVCRKDALADRSSNPLDVFYYDILPNSLAGFMTVAERQTNQFALAWDAKFAPLADADGDGLLSTANGGLDANDRRWDADNDGLADGFELQERADGQAYSPGQCDTDSDGLTDRQEAAIGSNPSRADSDNDGLADSVEVWHQLFNTTTCLPTANWSGGWDVTINDTTPFTVRVSSDPTEDDSDQDSVSDLAEKQLWENPNPALRVDKLNQPWHPTVPNVSPLAVFGEVNDVDRFVRVGQNLVYSTFATASIPLAPSLLDLNVPATLGGAQLPVPLTFNTEQTASNPFAFSVPGGSNGQQLNFTSSVRTRLPSSPPSFVWDDATVTYLGATAQPVRSMAVAPSTPLRQDSYLISTLTSDSAAAGGNGERHFNIIPSGALGVVPNLSATKMGTTAADVACDYFGECLIVHDSLKQDNTPGYIQAISLDSLGRVFNVLQFDYPNSPTVQYQPVIASDGQRSGIAYHTANSIRFEVWSVGFGPNIPDSTYTIPLPLYEQDSTSVVKDLVWIGDRYRLAVKYPIWVSNITRHEIALYDFSPDGSYLGQALVVPFHLDNVGNVNASPKAGPVLAYDPVHQQTLLIYQSTEPKARRVFIPKVSNNISNVTNWSPFNNYLGYEPGTTNTFNSENFDVAYDQRLDRWLINLNGYITYLANSALTNNGVGAIFPVLPVAPLTKVALACPATTSLPVRDFRFEELPGATSFGDITLFGATATCSGGSCPAAGLPGATDSGGNAVGTPASDYSVQFDANGDEITLSNPLGKEFSVAFWYKRNANLPQATNNPFFITSNPAGTTNNPGFGLYLHPGRLEWYSGLSSTGQATFISAQPQNGTLLLDGWHFVVATRAANGGRAIYVDGVEVASAPGNLADIADPTLATTIRLGGGSKPSGLDNLQFYNSALSGDIVQSLYNRTMQSYCVGASQYWHGWSKLNLSQPDPRGGKLTSASKTIALTLDGDLPTVSVSGLVNGQSILGNTTHIIGGSAFDATSGVGQIEIKVGNGAWTPIEGAESWAYSLPVTDGAVTLQLRATDAVGNLGLITTFTLQADGRAPQVRLNALPTAASAPTRNAANLWATTLTGTAIDFNSAGTTIGFPPVVEVALQGQVTRGNGWQRATQNVGNWTINYTFGATLPDPTGVYTVSVRAVDAAGNRTADNAASGILRLDAVGPVAALSNTDAARSLITNTLSISGVLTDTGGAGIDRMDVAFVTVDQLAAIPNTVNAAQADALLNRSWLPAVVVQGGAAVSPWSAVVPNGLEGEYQIDVRAYDKLGNLRRTDNIWRGIIDTLAPRVTLNAVISKIPFIRPFYKVSVSCRVDDRYVAESSFACPSNNSTVARIFNTDSNLQALFPDRTILIGLTNSGSYNTYSPPTQYVSRACDTFGRCSTTTINRTIPLVNAVAAADAAAATDNTVSAAEATALTAVPTVQMITPNEGSIVDAKGKVRVSVVAQASQPLKELVILLDNIPVQTIAFAQHEAITNTVQTAAVTIATAGPHSLAARATDWSGAQSALATVAFVADRQPPTVSLAQTVLSKEDSYGAQSNVLRFRGAASDDTTLVAVQIKVGDQPYADATFGNTASASGQWRTAYPVLDPEGKQLAVNVRALDAAGNITEISQTLGSDLSVVDAPDTTLGEKPVDPSSSTGASFSFTGSATAVAFECQLDDAPAVPCASPWLVNDLSNGSHTVQVAALNAEGFADLTPASHTWNVNVTTLATTLTTKPEATTTNRSASFGFSAAGASSFACSLDGSAYVACTSPKSYDKLGNGNHTFQVRAVGSTGSPTGGPATRYLWRVTNAAPTVVGDQVLMVVENSAVNVTLQSNDSDAVTYQIIEQPEHGSLLGVVPNLTYAPDTGYAGPDRFVYLVRDGEAASAPATVNITVRLGKYAVFAQEGVAFEQNSAVVRGNVGVNSKSAGPFLRNNVEASFSQNAKLQDPASRVLADSIVVDNNGVIYNPSYNDLTGKGKVNGTRTTPLALPLRAALPALPTITPGTQAVAVNGSQTLAPGSYGALTVNNNATLVLSGGLYHFASWTVSQNAKVHFAAPSEVRIAGALLANQNVFVGPTPGTTNVDANSIIIHIAGTDGQSGPGNQPRSAAFEQNVVVTAYVVAPNGMINFRQNVNATGVFIGKWVLAEQNAKVTRPGDPVVRAADVENGTGEAPVMTTPEITPTVVLTTVSGLLVNSIFLPVVQADAVVGSEAVDFGELSRAVSGTVSIPVTTTVVSGTVDFGELSRAVSGTVAVTVTPAITVTAPLTVTALLTATNALTTTNPLTATPALTFTETPQRLPDPLLSSSSSEAAEGVRATYLPIVLH